MPTSLPHKVRWLVLLVALATTQAHATLIVVPSSLANVEGNFNNGLPFHIAPFALNSVRYQQVYAASEFAAIGGGGFITELRFRPDFDIGDAFNSTIGQIRIDLSTTSRPVDGLSLTFADNIGPDRVIVYGGATGSSLPLSSADTGSGTLPRDFDIIIPFSTPFFYNPAQGNLLLDVTNFVGGLSVTTWFDAHNSTGDGISRISTFTQGSHVSATAQFQDSAGLVTQFQFTPVPEPSTYALCGVGIAVAVLARRRARRGKTP